MNAKTIKDLPITVDPESDRLRILLDEMLPPQTKTALPDHHVSSVKEMGWSGIKNGALSGSASGRFEVFLTADKNIRHQQNLKRFDSAVIVLPSNRVEIILGLSDKLTACWVTFRAAH